MKNQTEYEEKLLNQLYTRDIPTNKHKDITFHGIQLDINYGIFNPSAELTYSTISLISALPNIKDKKVLDIGTGSGVLAIWCAIYEMAKEIHAVDIQKRSVTNAKMNVAYHCRPEKIEIFQSNLFENVKDKYDIILANLPIIGASHSDFMPTQYQKLIQELPEHLEEGGLALITYASFGDHKILKKLRKKASTEISINALGHTWYVFSIKAE